MDQQTVVDSSPTEVADVFNGENLTLAEYNKYHADGEVPTRFKPAEQAEPAPADTPKEETPEGDEPETEPASEPEAQEQPQTGAQKRIKQLLAQTKELERQLAAKQTATPDPSPAKPQNPQSYADYRQTFKPSEWISQYAEKNPTASYEDANAAMADHLMDVREHFGKIEQRVNAEKQAIEAKVSEAKERYEDFDEIKDAFMGSTFDSKGSPIVPLSVLSIVNDSDYMPDVVYTIASDPDELAKFVAMAKANPNKAIRYVAHIESQIAAEFAKDAPVRGEDGKFVAPEPKKTAAPPPPKPVNGSSARAFDVSDESLSPEEWMRKRNSQLAAKT